MFFVPFIKTAVEQKKNVFIVCMSKGQEDGLTRYQELVSAAKVGLFFSFTARRKVFFFTREPDFFFSIHGKAVVFFHSRESFFFIHGNAFFFIQEDGLAR